MASARCFLFRSINKPLFSCPFPLYLKSMARSVFLFCALISVITTLGQTISIQIKDQEFKSPIAFSVVMNNSKDNGGTTDVNGQISLGVRQNECWTFTAFGYQSTKQCWKGENPWIIYLENKQLDLPELVINVKEDPAYKVMRNCIANAPQNDPQQSLSFQYQQYSKLILDFIKGKDPKIDSFFNEKHLMLMETVSKRKHSPPNYDHEEIIANQMSGFQVPQTTIIGTQLQSFSVYEADFQIFENVYLSPAGPRAMDRYEYKMLDTLYSGKDSTFVIAFSPKKRFITTGMKGTFHIHSSNFSVCQLIAEPAEKDVDLYVKIQQSFSPIEGTFFPTEINAFFELPNLANPLSGEIQTKIQNISKENYSFKDFDNVSLTLEEKANQVDSSEWAKIRYSPLTEKDLATYQFLDSLNRAQHLEKKTQFLTSLAQGNIQWGNMMIPAQRLFRFNAYEGYRLGLGIKGHLENLPPLEYETYVAHGSFDKDFKWGASLHWSFEPDVSGVRIQYFNDVKESGQQFFPFYRPNLNQSVYEIFATRMDKVAGGNVSTYFPIYKSLHADICYQNLQKQPHQDIHFFSEGNGKIVVTKYNLEEYRIILRWAPGERRVKILQRQYLLNGYWPIIKLGYTLSHWKLPGMSQSHSFTRYQAEVEKTFKTVYFGDFKFFAEVGKLVGDAPLTEVHAAKGTISPARRVSVSVPQSFETLPNSRWYARQFAHVFLRYRSNLPLYQHPSSAPSLTAIFNAGWGSLGRQDQYGLNVCKDYPKGLYESGLQLDNLLKASTGGLGIGAYYRFGPYHDPVFKNNWMIKLTSSLLF